MALSSKQSKVNKAKKVAMREIDRKSHDDIHEAVHNIVNHRP